MRTVLSVSEEQVFVLLEDFPRGLTLAELGLGGSPLAAEPGLDSETEGEGASVFAKEDNAISSDRAGICSEERVGLLD